MPLPRLPFNRQTTSGKQLISGSHINGLDNLLTGTNSGITALAGGARSASTPQLSSAFSEITVAAGAGDSVCLPPAKSGLRITVVNSGASSVNVNAAFGVADKLYPGNVDLLALPSGSTALYLCTKDGRWDRFVSA